MKRVSASHVFAILRLPEDDQDVWLRQAEQRAWSVRELERETRAERSSSRTGRPRKSRTLAVLEKLERIDASTLVDCGELAGVSRERSRELLEVVATWRGALHTMTNALNARLSCTQRTSVLLVLKKCRYASRARKYLEARDYDVQTLDTEVPRSQRFDVAFVDAELVGANAERATAGAWSAQRLVLIEHDRDSRAPRGTGVSAVLVAPRLSELAREVALHVHERRAWPC